MIKQLWKQINKPTNENLPECTGGIFHQYPVGWISDRDFLYSREKFYSLWHFTVEVSLVCHWWGVVISLELCATNKHSIFLVIWPGENYLLLTWVSAEALQRVVTWCLRGSSSFCDDFVTGHRWSKPKKREKKFQFIALLCWSHQPKTPKIIFLFQTKTEIIFGVTPPQRPLMMMKTKNPTKMEKAYCWLPGASAEASYLVHTVPQRLCRETKRPGFRFCGRAWLSDYYYSGFE